MRIDYYAVRAKEYKYLLEFIRRYPLEVYPAHPQESSSLLLLPNLLLASALCKKSIAEENGKQIGGQKVQEQAFKAFAQM